MQMIDNFFMEQITDFTQNIFLGYKRRFLASQPMTSLLLVRRSLTSLGMTCPFFIWGRKGAVRLRRTAPFPLFTTCRIVIPIGAKRNEESQINSNKNLLAYITNS